MRKREKQAQLDLFNAKQCLCFGGELLNGKRKTARPLSVKNPMHLVLRANKNILKKNEKLVRFYWNKFAKKFGIKTYDLSINSTHVHSQVRIHSRHLYNQFIQALSGALAKILGIEWIVRPFTRIVNGWRKAFNSLRGYIDMNELEAAGVIPYQPRKSRHPT